MKIKLSVVIITFNEEKNIERCLMSVKDIADDIVVVDSFSTDNTKQICCKHNVNFIEHKFEGHIEQKNYAITQAKYQYILSLDADEALTPELANSIKTIKQNWQYDGYSFNRLTNFCGKWIKHCGWYPDVKLRLWDSTKGKWGGVNPHDKYELNTGCSTKHINLDILHYSFYNINQHMHQVNYFSDISAQAKFDKGEKASLIKLIVAPYIKFIKSYIFQLGILDGFYGYVIAKNSAHATFLKYSKLRQLNKSKKVN